MKKITYILILSILSLILVSCDNINKNQLSKREKIKDFEYLYEVIKEGYPYLDVNKRLNNVDWIENKKEYLEKIKKTKNDEEFKSEMAKIVSDLNNDHTKLVETSYEYTNFKNIYYTSGWYDFFDDDNVKDRYDNLVYRQPSSNSRATGSLTVKDVIDDKIGYMYLPEMSSSEKDLEPVVEYIQTLKNHQALIIDIRGNGGGSDGYWSNIVSRLIKEDVKTNGYMLFRSDNEVVKNYVDKRGIAIEPIDNLPKEVKKNAPIEVSQKFTGYSSFVERGIQPYESINFDGNIYLLVDEFVYSSAESFAIFCKDSKLATIIGETTKGDGGGYDPLIFNLKNSGLLVRMSSDMYLTKDGICNEEFKTTPDYIIENSKRSSSFAEDECINKVLEIEDVR